MPLALNREHAHATPEPLLDCFHAMAEDPDFAMLTKRFPTMRSLCGTRGEPYSSAELSRLGSFLASHFDLPRPTGGLEALVHLERGRGVADARGWTTVVAADGVAGVGEDFGLPSETWKSGPLFDGEHERILRQIGSDVLRSADPPSLFLIWENSD